MAEKTYVVVEGAVGPFLQGEFVTLQDWQAKVLGSGQERLDELAARGALREATDAEIKAGSAAHSDRDASFVEDQSADENRARIRELEARIAVLEGKEKAAAQKQVDALADATATRNEAVQGAGDANIAAATGQPLKGAGK
jgi:BMFP domain-containing protein YqiC